MYFLETKWDFFGSYTEKKMTSCWRNFGTGDTGSYQNDKYTEYTLQWRHNEHHGVSNHRPLDCLYNGFVYINIKENIKTRVTGPFWRESTGDRWIPLRKCHLRGNHFQLMTSSCWGLATPFVLTHRGLYKTVYILPTLVFLRIILQISLKFLPIGHLQPTSVQVMAWYRTGDKSFSEPMMTNATWSI